MQYILPVHELNPLTNLAHEHGACALCQDEVFVDDSLEQLPACYPAREDEKVNDTSGSHAIFFIKGKQFEVKFRL